LHDLLGHHLLCHHPTDQHGQRHHPFRCAVHDCVPLHGQSECVFHSDLSASTHSTEVVGGRPTRSEGFKITLRSCKDRLRLAARRQTTPWHRRDRIPLPECPE
jgi:hypothetical protein